MLAERRGLHSRTIVSLIPKDPASSVPTSLPPLTASCFDILLGTSAGILVLRYTVRTLRRAPVKLLFRSRCGCRTITLFALNHCTIGRSWPHIGPQTMATAWHLPAKVSALPSLCARQRIIFRGRRSRTAYRNQGAVKSGSEHILPRTCSMQANLTAMSESFARPPRDRLNPAVPQTIIAHPVDDRRG